MKLNEKILLAGFGGQGILVAGRVLAETFLHSNFNASWVPSYGPEMRGGTCNCQVVVSDEKIKSPIFTRPHTAIIMNEASYVKFASSVLAGGFLICNTSLFTPKPNRNYVLYEVRATEIAQELGDVRCANMVMLGAYSKAKGLVKLEQFKNLLKTKFTGSILSINESALEKGFSSAVVKN